MGARYSDLILEAKQRIEVRLDGSRAETEARAGHCLDERVGRSFDLPALQAMARIVQTEGGYVLWEHAMRETAQSCYDESVGHKLIGFTPSLTWLAAKGLHARLPRHDPSRGIPPSLAGELETLCGERARGALQVRDGRLGIRSQWRKRTTPARRAGRHLLLPAQRREGVGVRAGHLRALTGAVPDRLRPAPSSRQPTRRTGPAPVRPSPG